MRIGVFLAYPPKTRLKGEGLSRYLANMVIGFLSAGHQVTIACPKWSVATLQELLEDYDVQSDSVTWLVLHKEPVLWGIYNLFTSKRQEKKRKRQIDTAELVEAFLGNLVSITNFFLFVVFSAFVGLIALLALPFVLLGVAGYFVLRFFKRTIKGSMQGMLDFMNCVFRKLHKSNASLGTFFQERISDFTQEQLVGKINNYILEIIDIWFVPSAFWPNVNLINSLTVINVPDLVTVQFPEIFSYSADFVYATEQVKRTIKKGQYYITYSEFLKKSLLVDQFGISPEAVVAIAHPVNNILDKILIDEKIERSLNSRKDFTTAFARSVLQTAVPCIKTQAPSYLVNINFHDVKYIFYASQNRPHKNLLNFLKAYKYLLREEYCNIKLFLTADPSTVQQVNQFIIEHRLQLDVVCFCGVSTQQLAALYRCALLTVNPTLYEGGFPFTFGEGMSVGTPSVMSRIPQVTEVADGYDLDAMLFDPYNWKNMADTILRALENPYELYEKELPLFKKLCSRTQEIVAQEYITAFENFLMLDYEKAEQEK